jgi:hypothetical protein
LSDKNVVTSGVVVGSKPTGIGSNSDGEPGAEMGCVVSRVLPGGSTCTSVWMVGVLVVAGAGGGAPGASDANVANKFVAWFDASWASTF